MRFLKKNSLTRVINDTAIAYPAPVNLPYIYNFGVFSLVCLAVQLVTGIILVMHYVPHIDLAFASVEHIMRDVNYGWLLRYTHANGASIFFIVVYIHIFRGVYYGSYLAPREALWLSGVTILLLMIVTAFLGYILPWGQMSFWGATVITNLVSVIPFFGETIVQWLWGGFSVDNPTLNKFFSLHYLLPFVILGLVVLHMIFLHENGSSNPLGVNYRTDAVPFTPYFMIKDFYSVLLLFLFFTVLVFFNPNLLGHPDNYIMANSAVTPAHIVPEWYFLPFYAILRSIPSKMVGVLALLASILVLYTLPYIHKTHIRSSTFKPLYQWFYWIFVSDCILLGYFGAQPVEEPFLTGARIASAFYFIFFIILYISSKYNYSIKDRYINIFDPNRSWPVKN